MHIQSPGMSMYSQAPVVSHAQVVSQVTVTDIQQLSPTVKGFTLQVANTQLSFKPGQWYVGW